MVIRYESSNELYHHGVKGMRWGVRRTRKAVRETRKSFKYARKEAEAGLKAYTSIGTKRKESAMKSYWKRRQKSESFDSKLQNDSSERRAFAKQATQSWIQRNRKKLIAVAAIGAGAVGAVAIRGVLKRRKLNAFKVNSPTMQSLVATGREYIRF